LILVANGAALAKAHPLANASAGIRAESIRSRRCDEAL
jgi:hypothetical protein